MEVVADGSSRHGICLFIPDPPSWSFQHPSRHLLPVGQHSNPFSFVQSKILKNVMKRL